MTQRAVKLDLTGAITLAPTIDNAIVGIDYDLYNYLGDNIALDISFSSKTTTPTKASQIIATLKWSNILRQNTIYQVQGTLSNDEDDISSLWNIAGATKYFKTFEMSLGTDADIIEAVKNSSGWNPLNSRGRNSQRLTLPLDEPASQNADDIYKILTNLKGARPAGFAIANIENLVLYNAALRACEKVNIPLDIELSPYLEPLQAINLASGLDANSAHVQLIYSICEARPRDAVSFQGRTKPFHAIGQIIGNKMLRNAQTSAEGISKIADPVAGYDYPLRSRGLQQREDIILDEELLEAFAVAKINVVREIEYDTGTRFVLSDTLTQYDSKTSALRVVNAAEIAFATTNRVTDILKRHMLKRMPSYISDASKDIEKYMDACYGAGLLENAEDLGGLPYRFNLVPDVSMPFERVRLSLERRPVGSTRSVIFDDDILVK